MADAAAQEASPVSKPEAHLVDDYTVVLPCGDAMHRLRVRREDGRLVMEDHDATTVDAFTAFGAEAPRCAVIFATLKGLAAILADNWIEKDADWSPFNPSVAQWNALRAVALFAIAVGNNNVDDAYHALNRAREAADYGKKWALLPEMIRIRAGSFFGTRRIGGF
jgi:hypothetical protein